VIILNLATLKLTKFIDSDGRGPFITSGQDLSKEDFGLE
jgi:hypothetical protein